MSESWDSGNLAMSTLRQKADVRDEVPSVRVLTILCHPDVARIGERARLDELGSGRPISVSRLEPLFAQPGGGAARPLADPYISRQPLKIAVASAGTLRLIPSDVDAGEIDVEGQPLAGPLTVSDDPGVVLQLSRRVVLLLHREPLHRHVEAALGLVGESSGLGSVRRRILDVAPLPVSVLIRGESGTGKELVAQAIHARGPRADGPFVAVNLGALTPALAASELFGHVRGAFTDARESKPGLFAKADGGTLFLDEVGQAPPEVQAGLLRVLETREVQPVGAERPRRVDVRVVAATDANLEQAIADRRFTEALLHRLAAYEIRLPPLRERIDDMARLLLHFLRESLASLGATRNLTPKGAHEVPWLPAPLVAKLARHPWPGNVRELRNVATQIAVTSHGEPRARMTDEIDRRFAGAMNVYRDPEEEVVPVRTGVPREGDAARQRAAIRAGGETGAGPEAVREVGSEGSGALRPKEISEEGLLAVLADHDWNLVRAAAALAISRTTLYTLIRRYGLQKGVNASADEIRRCREECGGDIDLMAQRLRVPKRALIVRLAQL